MFILKILFVCLLSFHSYVRYTRAKILFTLFMDIIPRISQKVININLLKDIRKSSNDAIITNVCYVNSNQAFSPVLISYHMILYSIFSKKTKAFLGKIFQIHSHSLKTFSLLLLLFFIQVSNYWSFWVVAIFTASFMTLEHPCFLSTLLSKIALRSVLFLNNFTSTLLFPLNYAIFKKLSSLLPSIFSPLTPYNINFFLLNLVIKLHSICLIVCLLNQRMRFPRVENNFITLYLQRLAVQYLH